MVAYHLGGLVGVEVGLMRWVGEMGGGPFIWMKNE